jgi:hypothetical protein
MLISNLAVAFFAVLAPSAAQTIPAATGPIQHPYPFTIGGGASDLNVDWSRSRMLGVAMWVDWHPKVLLRSLDGLGVEVEGRDLDFDRPSQLASGYRQDTLGGGVIYTYRHFSKVRPFGKFLIDYGRLNYGYGQIATATVRAPAFGFEYRAINRLWVRADYEYQIWPNLLNGIFPGYTGKSLDPQGFTLGVSYDFRRVRLFP